MSWSDPIADMLTRIRNAQTARLPTVSMPASRMKGEIARVMRETGFIGAVTEQGEGVIRKMHITLKYSPEGEPVIRGLRRVSSPGLRKYSAAKEIPMVLGGMGVTVVSTPQGVMSGRDARKANLGGEVVCSIW